MNQDSSPCGSFAELCAAHLGTSHLGAAPNAGQSLQAATDRSANSSSQSMQFPCTKSGIPSSGKVAEKSTTLLTPVLISSLPLTSVPLEAIAALATPAGSGAASMEGDSSVPIHIAEASLTVDSASEFGGNIARVALPPLSNSLASTSPTKPSRLAVTASSCTTPKAPVEDASSETTVQPAPASETQASPSDDAATLACAPPANINVPSPAANTVPLPSWVSPSVESVSVTGDARNPSSPLETNAAPQLQASEPATKGMALANATGALFALNIESTSAALSNSNSNSNATDNVGEGDNPSISAADKMLAGPMTPSGSKATTSTNPVQINLVQPRMEPLPVQASHATNTKTDFHPAPPAASPALRRSAAPNTVSTTPSGDAPDTLPPTSSASISTTLPKDSSQLASSETTVSNNLPLRPSADHFDLTAPPTTNKGNTVSSAPASAGSPSNNPAPQAIASPDANRDSQPGNSGDSSADSARNPQIFVGPVAAVAPSSPSTQASIAISASTAGAPHQTAAPGPSPQASASQRTTSEISASVPSEPSLPATGPVQMAQMIARASQSEMKIGLTTSAFGNVEVRAQVHANDVGVLIGSEKGDLRSMLSAELPGLAGTLQQQNLRLAQVSFQQGGFAFSSGMSSGGNNQGRTFSPKPNSFMSPAAEPSLNDSPLAADTRSTSTATGLSILA
jgi:hypothetical protein